jgi:hypothetical protein
LAPQRSPRRVLTCPPESAPLPQADSVCTACQLFANPLPQRSLLCLSVSHTGRADIPVSCACCQLPLVFVCVRPPTSHCSGTYAPSSPHTSSIPHSGVPYPTYNNPLPNPLGGAPVPSVAPAPPTAPRCCLSLSASVARDSPVSQPPTHCLFAPNRW